MVLDTPTDKRKRRTHTAVLDGARSLFLRHGYRATTIEMLATAADVAVSSIYANFPAGKVDIYAALAWRTAQSHAEQMTAPTDAVESAHVVAEFLDRYIAFHRDDPLALRLLALTDVDKSESASVGEAKEKIDTALGELIDSVTRAVEDAGADVLPRALVLNAWAAMNGAVSLHQRRIVDRSMLDAMLAITRADMLRHLKGTPDETR
ncbi:TetR/AcrR family transcriptional regulator [Rhodococcus fascians]|uniref:TetR/AcrR family transcriptional regulator n=1 Tax=Nocardiaceae TaxID=85025 RepID=UPI00050BDFF8|nr:MULTISPECIES: TetR/AcrR family transcriptional regulator [Rhodococcus]MBY4036532.1 TetR/AcrR family transcriptional regulator [Rhodococcus fascians]MBY4139820.1 TetR/AcrR family transcriptional regulator [Rhodococcus fascians]MBY4216628.1 TetR/AcrR family transcriptional regulator [Rhodococcus fascians]MBY4224225.1 TetR/AcrR family transcriptional regulator [Rhodococcus fascians]MBY4230301.1 TetR/AcrR family transcriptional regulator [Rhodococcus fascians]